MNSSVIKAEKAFWEHANNFEQTLLGFKKKKKKKELKKTWKLKNKEKKQCLKQEFIKG